MKQLLPAQTALAIAAIGVAFILAIPTMAAGQADRAGGGAASGGGASAGGSSGTTSAGGGADRGGGGGGGFVGGSSAGSHSGGDRAGATGGSGMAMPRAGGGDHSGGSGTSRYAGGSAGRTTGRTQDDPGEHSGVPPYSRPHDPNATPVGTAVPRPPNSTPTRGGGGTYVIPGGYYGGYGLGYPYGGGYYGGYYDPWYDPWYGGYPAYGGGYQTTSGDEGSLRLKIKPKNAEVYADGYFEGTVDDFDGIFQRLHLDAGIHRIEVRAAGYESLTFEVRISADHTTTYQGEMHRIQ